MINREEKIIGLELNESNGVVTIHTNLDSEFQIMPSKRELKNYQLGDLVLVKLGYKIQNE